MRVEWIAALLLLAGPAAARPRKLQAPPPQAGSLLERALSLPGRDYRASGRVKVFVRGKKKAKGISFEDSALADGRFRRELRRGKRKPAAAVILNDGRKRWELIESLKTAWSGEVYEEPASAQVSRLQRLYEIEVKSGGRVAKRAVWRVNMRVQGGALRRSMWVDRENFLVLKSEIYRDDSTVSWRERVQKWEEISPEPAQFLAHVPEGWQTLPLNVPRHVADLGFQPAIPRWLPPGYFPLKARYEAGQCVIEYGDGIETLSLTQTMGESASHALGLPRLTAQGVLQMTWSQGGRTYRLDGGRAEDELVRVAESLK